MTEFFLLLFEIRKFNSAKVANHLLEIRVTIRALICAIKDTVRQKHYMCLLVDDRVVAKKIVRPSLRKP